MNVPDIAIINFSSVNDRTVQRAVRAINRQVFEDFMPIWGSAYMCKVLAPAYELDDPDVVAPDQVAAKAVIFLVDNAHLQTALGYHTLNSAALPVGFVFTDLGDWTVSLSHEVMEMIVDPTANRFVPGPDPRAPLGAVTPDWLWHSYEVCDPVERTVYEIDEIMVSNFVTPSYFAKPVAGGGNEAGRRNDFLGIGVDAFGLLPGCRLGARHPESGEWLDIQGSEFPSRRPVMSRMKAFAKPGNRPRPGEREHQGLLACIAALAAVDETRAAALRGLGALTRSGRKQFSQPGMGCAAAYARN